jgi:hypothetical protein
VKYRTTLSYFLEATDLGMWRLEKLHQVLYMWSFTRSADLEFGSVRKVVRSRVHATMFCVEKDFHESARMYP